MHKSGTRNGKQLWTCRSGGKGETRTYCYSTLSPESVYVRNHEGKSKEVAARKPFKRRIEVERTLIFTAAQNATPVHEGFFAALKSFAADQDAELCVIPLRYKNATSQWTESQQNAEHWLRDVAEAELGEDGVNRFNFHEEVGTLMVSHNIIVELRTSWQSVCDQYSAKYLYEQRRKLNENLVVVGDMKIQPTTGDPLTGVEGMTQGESGIFGHTKLRMKCIATPQQKMPKVLTTTGACTVPNYTDSKAGKKGQFHHVLGAVVIQIESSKKFHMYHINARKSDGAFIFHRTAYHADGTIEDAGPAQAIIFGDAHYRFADPKVVEATFGRGGLVEQLDPEVLVWHDLLDCYFGNPHHRDNPFIEIAKRRANYHLAREEVEETVRWAQDLGAGRKAYIVASNHDDMFARWIVREDWKDHPDNAEFYLETALQMARSAKMSEIGAEYLDPFGYWVGKITNNDPMLVPLSQNQSLMIAGIECGYHGDKGPNGARGTVKNLSAIGVKVISGHGHSPAYQDGHTRTGTMTRLTAEYVDGPNNWLNTHASIDAFGKRHLHTCIDGNFWL